MNDVNTPPLPFSQHRSDILNQSDIRIGRRAKNKRQLPLSNTQHPASNANVSITIYPSLRIGDQGRQCPFNLRFFSRSRFFQRLAKKLRILASYYHILFIDLNGSFFKALDIIVHGNISPLLGRCSNDNHANPLLKNQFFVKSYFRQELAHESRRKFKMQSRLAARPPHGYPRLKLLRFVAVPAPSCLSTSHRAAFRSAFSMSGIEKQGGPFYVGRNFHYPEGLPGASGAVKKTGDDLHSKNEVGEKQ